MGRLNYSNTAAHRAAIRRAGDRGGCQHYAAVCCTAEGAEWTWVTEWPAYDAEDARACADYHLAAYAACTGAYSAYSREFYQRWQQQGKQVRAVPFPEYGIGAPRR